MMHFHNAMMIAAERLQNSVAKPRIGTVSAYDPNTFMVKVTLQPEAIESGWLQLGSPMVGNQYGVFCAPMIGDQVEVQFIDGDISSGVVSMRFFNDAARALTVQAGEMWIVHQSGSLIKLTNDGRVTVTDKAGSTATLNGDGTATVTASSGLTINANTQLNGNLIVSGSISDQNGTKGTVQKIRDSYDVHTHGGVQPGTGNTSTPSNTL